MPLFPLSRCSLLLRMLYSLTDKLMCTFTVHLVGYEEMVSDSKNSVICNHRWGHRWVTVGGGSGMLCAPAVFEGEAGGRALGRASPCFRPCHSACHGLGLVSAQIAGSGGETQKRASERGKKTSTFSHGACQAVSRGRPRRICATEMQPELFLSCHSSKFPNLRQVLSLPAEVTVTQRTSAARDGISCHDETFVSNL